MSAHDPRGVNGTRSSSHYWWFKIGWSVWGKNNTILFFSFSLVPNFYRYSRTPRYVSVLLKARIVSLLLSLDIQQTRSQWCAINGCVSRMLIYNISSGSKAARGLLHYPDSNEPVMHEKHTFWREGRVKPPSELRSRFKGIFKADMCV